MTATETGPTAALVLEAWDLYRRSRELPWTGDLHKAQARLMDLLEPHTRTRIVPLDGPGPDEAAIRAACERLRQCEAREDARTLIAARHLAQMTGLGVA